jgi:probable rRNA maturation factor
VVELNFINSTSYKFDKSQAAWLVLRALSGSKALESKLPATGVISVKLAPVATLRRLNKEFAGKDEATDVLSFPYDSVDELGDVVISTDHIKAQAKAAGSDELTELVLLILHGVLHIIGFDHQTSSQQQRLDSLQEDLMSSVGLSYRDFKWQA